VTVWGSERRSITAGDTIWETAAGGGENVLSARQNNATERKALMTAVVTVGAEGGLAADRAGDDSTKQCEWTPAESISDPQYSADRH